jgi:hypothetical protein
VLISSHLLKMIPWAGHKNSHVAMRKHHGWPEGSDDEVLHVGFDQFLGQVMTDRMVPCEDVLVG